MPAFYTHYRFGCDVLKQLPEDIRSICTAHRGLFDIGLHGPDIYFFYRPVLPNKVNRIGYAAHTSAPGATFYSAHRRSLRLRMTKMLPARISTGFCATLRWILSATRTSTRR
ncbi:hypothetical protein [Hominenteromicrobium sp.]|uniref:hypothetical protein n=1 Tax=Hominenteromicrobium sp. TaxID=3073581 RepID=UPI00399BFF55